MSTAKQYWFPAKRYGWGWGLPRTWQGWVVTAVYLAAMTVAALWLVGPQAEAARLTSMGLLTLGLVAVCWIKGEPPSWRWGR